ncbi:hypothetical protein B0A50_03093 [Salinomyces thailandicus]|uniref:RING-type domain-containing protein n=1 Tax=Salinomyces thailandicus TaxID=706561 RepID=A0A4U0U3T3_9PEZI|nr:hypothetical protein B0A50_03093 [Salinomyces thailandica]
MGTLTAGQPRLDGYCDHKLPTSCRLTSIPECCACADERGHSAAYSTYIDGVGFVQRGTRWQRYCWFCKEFWENRVRASGLRQGQTRIPEVPDQSDFLARWYEFHQGYRTVLQEDGREERIAVLGEEFRHVSPGYLPRTLEELREGRAANDMAEQSLIQQVPDEQTETGPSLEDTLDQMFQAASMEEDQPGPANQPNYNRIFRENVQYVIRQEENERSIQTARRNNIHAQAMAAAGNRNREYQTRRVAALRRELHRMRNGIERVITGLRDLGENVPDNSEASGRLTELGRTLDNMGATTPPAHPEQATIGLNPLASEGGSSQSDRTLTGIQARVDEARQQANEARRNRDQAMTELDAAEQELRTSQHRFQQLQREQRTTENYLRLFGSREEMLAQGDQYESPIGGLFSRAMDRFRAAEDVRREERTLRRVLDDESRAGGEDGTRRLAELQGRERDVWGVPRPAGGEDELAQEPRGELEEYYALIRRQGWEQQAPPHPIQQNASEERDISLRNVNNDDFPRNMLNGVMASRESVQGRNASNVRSPAIEIAELPPSQPEVATSQDDWVSDVEHILLCSLNDFGPSVGYTMTISGRRSLLDRTYGDALTEEDERSLRHLLNNDEVVWRSGLTAARLLRQRRMGIRPTLQRDVASEDVASRTCNAEIMAEAFQMSSEVRRRAPQLRAPEQLSMLYRIQASERTMADYNILQQMLDDPETVDVAARVHDQISLGDALNVSDPRQETLDDRRRLAARQGDNTRQELDAQRRATQALAVAAGRTAMRAGNSTLLEQMAERDEETRVAYERLRQNGFAPEGDTSMAHMLRRTMYRPLDLADYDGLDSPSESEEEEEDEAQGLDAKDTGRPEPKTDEEMTISMECRVCYTQLAEVACLPCGHLVMCKWCSEQHSPVMAHDRTRPRRAAGCPLCRKAIRQKVRVFRA